MLRVNRKFWLLNMQRGGMRLCCDDICFLTQASTGRNQLQNHHNLASSGFSVNMANRTLIWVKLSDKHLTNYFPESEIDSFTMQDSVRGRQRDLRRRRQQWSQRRRGSHNPMRLPRVPPPPGEPPQRLGQERLPESGLADRVEEKACRSGRFEGADHVQGDSSGQPHDFVELL